VQGVEAMRATASNRSRSDSRASSNSKGDDSAIKSVSSHTKARAKGNITRAEGPYGEEAQFADDMWDELMGKGYMCGDERWLVGEDSMGDITILHF
jgi:hypothetical protein